MDRKGRACKDPRGDLKDNDSDDDADDDADDADKMGDTSSDDTPELDQWGESISR